MERSLKKSGLQRYQWDALPTELYSYTSGTRSIYWVRISREERNQEAEKRLQATSFQLLKLEKLNCNVHSSPSSTTAVRIELFHISFTSKCKLVIYQLWYYYFGCEITSTLRKCLRALLPEIIICFEKGHLRLSFEIFNLVKDPFYSLGVKDLEQVNFISVELPLSLHFNEDS